MFYVAESPEQLAQLVGILSWSYLGEKNLLFCSQPLPLALDGAVFNQAPGVPLGERSA
jgi:hypothetical protein